MPYFKIIGAGSVELSPFRYSSGLIVSDDVYHLAIDITPRNAFGIVDTLHDKYCAFAVTHGHADHFDPEIPWREIYDHRFAQFGKGNEERVLFAHESTIRFMLKYNGLYRRGLLSDQYAKLTVKEITVKKKKNTVFISNGKHRGSLKIILLRCVDKCLRQNGAPKDNKNVDFSKTYRWGKIKFLVFNAYHPWNMPPAPPYIVKNGTTLGFFFIKPFLGIYLPDFDLTDALKRTITSLIKRFSLNYMIVGMTNPKELETDSVHAGVSEFLEYVAWLKGSLNIEFTTIFTHRNPNWERFKPTRLADVKLATNGEVYRV